MDESRKKYESILINLKYDLKQDIIYGAFPSLQYRSLNNLAITLWHDTLGQADFTLFNKTNTSEKLNDFAKKIIYMVSNQSSLPFLYKPQLMEMVYIIGKEIEIFFNDQAHKLYLKSLDSYKIYLANICWNDQSTINKVKTVEQIIDNDSVSTLRKYILACNYCLEDKIENLLKLLPKNFIDFFEGKEDPFCLVIFWTYYKRGEIEKFSTFDSGMETIAYLLSWAIFMNMEASVQYIWENFADQTAKLEAMTDVTYSEDVNPNIAFYILRNWDENFKDEVCEKFFCNGLSKLHSISRWCNIVPLAKYLSELNSEIFTVTQAFRVASFCWHKKFFDVEQFSTLWDEICSKFEFTLEENFIVICKKIFYRYDASRKNGSKEDIHIEKLLLGLCTSDNKERFVNNIRINYNVATLIINNGTHSFDILFKEFFESEVETEIFKYLIFKTCSRSICSELIEVENYERLNEFLINFCPAYEISKFKNEYYLYDDYFMTRFYYKHIGKMDPLKYVNNFLNWSFEGNNEKINQFKAKIYDLESSEYSEIHFKFFRAFHQLINKNEWELVEKYWNWIFFATEKKIVTVEEKFARIKKIFSVFQSEGFYLGTIKYCTLFKMIISLCFKKYKLEEIVEVVNRENDVAALVEEYLEFDNHLELKDLLGGSFYLKENINKNATRFMFSHSCSFMFELNKGDPTVYNVKFLFKWFNPSVQSAKLFKKGFLNFVTRKENNGCKLLKKREKIKLIMEVGQYLIKMLINVLNHQNIFLKEINEDIFENNEHEENDKRKREDAPFKCGKKIKLTN